MKLGLPDDSVPVQEMFERFFAAESTPARVRAAEPVGSDPDLWRQVLRSMVAERRLGLPRSRA